MKSSFLKYLFFPVLFLLVFQGEGRGEVFSGFGKEEQVLTAAKNHVNNLPSEGLALVKLTDAKAIAAQTSSLPPNKMFELIKSYTIGDPSEIDFVGNMNSIQGFYVKAAIDARSAGKMDDVATFYAALEQMRKYRQLEPLKAHIDAVSDLWQDVEKLDLFISDLASNKNLLDFFKAVDDATRLKYAGAWEGCFKDATKRLDIPWLTKLSESTGISKIDNINPSSVSWENNIIGHNSSVSAVDFWNDISKNVLHYEQGDFIFKYDYDHGKLLLGNKSSGKIIGFYEGVENATIGIYDLSPSNIVQKLKRYHGESGPSSPIFNLPYNNQIASTPGKTTTIVGKFTYYPYFSGDMKSVIEELLGNLKTQDFGPKSGGFNVLNVSDNLYDPATFWNTYNKPWLQAAINRGDEIAAASNPLDINNLFYGLNGIPQLELNILNGLSTPEQFANYFKNLNDPDIYAQLSGFGQEFELLSKSDYILDLGSKKFIK